MSGPTSTPVPEAATAPAAPGSQSMFFSPRSRRQLSLFAAGAGFFALSTVVTRRSIARRYKASIPKFYHPSNHANTEINGALEAFEALNIATVNVLSVGMMLSGGLLWAFDISSVEDIRKKVRTKIGANTDRTDQDAEKEIEEWLASVLARKEFKVLRGEKGIQDTKDTKDTKDKDQEEEKKR